MQKNFNSLNIKVLCFLLLVGNILSAQTARIDSLKKDYNKAIQTGIADYLRRIDSLTKALNNAKDTSRVNTLNELSNTYRFINSDTGLAIAKQAYEEAKKIRHKNGMMRATRISMLTYMNRGDV